MANIEGSAIAFPFSINQSGGVSFYKDNDAAIWQDRVRYVIFTQMGERVMRPDFGSRVQDLVFENNYSTTALATKIVAAAFAKWLPSLTLNNVVATPDDVNYGLNLEIDYTIPNGQRQQLSTQTKVFNRYGEIVQGE